MNRLIPVLITALFATINISAQTGTDNCDNIGGDQIMDGVTILANNNSSTDGTVWFYYMVPNDGFQHDISITVTPGTLGSATFIQYNGSDTNLDGDYCNDGFTAATGGVITVCPGSVLVFEVGDTGGALGDFDVDLVDTQGASNNFAFISHTETSGNNPNDMEICEGDSADLTESGGVSWQWDDPTSSTAGTVTVTPTATTTYNVTATDANGCTDTEMITITVHPLPIAVITETDASGNIDDDMVCDGGSADLTASGASTYAWDDPTFATSALVTVTPTATTTYTVTATDVNGCTDTEQITITVNPLPVASISHTETSGNNTDDMTICEGDSADLTGAGGTSYTWDDPTSATTATVTVSPITTTTYTVTATDVNGCTDTEQITITVNPLPIATISHTETSGNNNDDMEICEGDSADLTGAGASTYAWDDPTAATTATVTVTPTVTTTYTVTATDVNGCTDTEQMIITVNPLPIAAITETDVSGNADDSIICDGDSADLTGTGASTYAWDDPSSATTATVTVTPTVTTTYTVTATDVNGCTDTEQITITVNPPPTAAVTHTETSGSTNDDTEICEGDSADLTASGANTYAWDDPTSATTATVTVTPTVTTTYTVTATDVDGCTDTEQITITVYPLPMAVASITNNPICSFEDLLLTETGGSAGVTWAWSSDLGTATYDNNTNQNPMAMGVTDLEVFTVTVTDANGCTATSSTTAMVTPGPANDDCANATALTLGNNTGFNNVCASFDTPMGSCGNPQDLSSVWFTYTVTSSVNELIFDLTGTSITSPGFAVFDGCGGVLQGEDCGGSQIIIDCPAQITYYIQVGSDVPDAGSFELDVTEGNGSQPANDDCSGAIDISPSVTCVFESVSDDNTDACPENFTNCDSDTSPTIWFTFTTGVNTTAVDFSNFGSTEQITVVDACTPTTANCFTSPGSFTGVSPSTQYWVAVNLGPGVEGAIDFDIRFIEGPANDDPCGDLSGFQLAAGGTAGGTTNCAGADFFGANCTAADTENAVFYEITIGSGLSQVEIAVTAGNGGPYFVGIFSNDCNNPLVYECDANTAIWDCPIPGDYLVQVSSSSADAGDFSVSMSETAQDPTCTANDDCDAAEVLNPANNCMFDTVNACNMDACPESFTGCGFDTNPTTYYEITVPAGVTSIEFANITNGGQIAIMDHYTDCTMVPSFLAGSNCMMGAGPFGPFAVTAGATYTIIASDPAGSMMDFDIKYITPPANDDCANAVVGGSSTGSTCCATGASNGDIPFVNCTGTAGESTVWFEFTPSGTQDYVTVTFTNTNMTGNMGIEVYSGTGCTLNFEDSFCGNVATGGSETFDISCLPAGESLYVQVGSTDAGCGDFSVDFMEVTGTACVFEDVCDPTIPVIMPSTDGAQACVSSCNTYACTEGGDCGENTVWFQVMTDGTAGAMLIFVNGAPFNANINVLAVDCSGSGGNPVACVQADNVDLGVNVNTTYFISVGMSAGDTPGDFDLCVATVSNAYDCYSGNIQSTRPEFPNENQNGPFCPGEKVNICVDINFLVASALPPNGNNCQWLQGIVPAFGGGWDLDACPIDTQEPPNFGWEPENTVDYNFNSSILGISTNSAGQLVLNNNGGLTAGQGLPGGFWATSNGGAGCTNDGDPDNMWGWNTGICDGTQSLTWCFDLQVKEIDDPSQCLDPDFTDLDVTVFAFADGETGCWQQIACTLSLPIDIDYDMDCSQTIGVMATGGELCSGNTVDIFATADDGSSDILVVAIDNPNVSGETPMSTLFGGSGTLTESLTNTTCNVEIVEYEVSAINPGSVCPGPKEIVEVTVYPEVMIDFDPPYEVCFDATTEIIPTVKGGVGPPYTYAWSDGTSGSSVTVPTNVGVDPPGSYTMFVTVVDAFGCEKVEDFTFEIVEPLFLTVDPTPITFCRDGITDFPTFEAIFFDPGNGAYTYNWTSNGPIIFAGPTDQSTVSINEEGSQPGTWFINLTVTDRFGCEYYSQAEVTIDNGPDMLSDLVDCGMDDYTWNTYTTDFSSADFTVYDINGTIVNGPLFNSSITTTVIDPGIYYIEAKNPNTCCLSVTEFEVIERITPDLSISQTGPYCIGDDVTITLNNASDFATITWFHNSVPNTGNSFTLTNLQATTLVTFQGQDNNLCFSVEPFDIIVNDNPDVQIAGSSNFCPGDSTTLCVDTLSGYNYLWVSPSNDSTFNNCVRVGDIGFWNVTVTDANGCFATAVDTVAESSVLTPQIIGDTLCNGDMVTLNAGMGFSSYQWSDASGPIAGETNQTLTVTAAGTYTIDVVQGSCAGTGSYEVIAFNPPNLPDLTPITACNADTGIGADSIVLNNFVNPANVAGAWTDQNGLPVNVVSFNGITPGTVEVFTYITAVAQGNCAEDTTRLEVTILDCACPDAGIATPNAFCAEADTFDLSILIQPTTDPGGFTVDPPGNLDIVGNDLIIDENDAGVYQIVYTLTNPGGGTCAVADTVVLTISDPSELDVTTTAQACNFAGSGLGDDFVDLNLLVLSGSGDWSTAEPGITIPASNIVNFNGVAPGSYDFTINSNDAVAPCTNFPITVTIDVVDCTCSQLSLDALPDLCNDDDELNLSSFLDNPDALPGIWSVDPPNTTIINSNFDATDLTAGVYTLTYTLSPMQAGNCTNDVSQSFEVFAQPQALIIPDTFACNNTTTPLFPTSVDLDGLLISGDNNGTWAAPSGFTGTINGTVVDLTGVTPGGYIFTYSLPANGVCDGVDIRTLINVVDCDCPFVDFNPIPPLCSNDDFVQLESLLGPNTDPADGVWSFTTGPDNITLQPGVVFDATDVTPGDYIFTFTLNTVPSGCDPEAMITIPVFAPPTATVTPNITVCNAMSPQAPSFVDLTMETDDPNGRWTAPANYNGGQISDETMVDFTGLPIGDYVFTFLTGSAIAPCEDVRYELTISVVDCNCTLISFGTIPDLCNDMSMQILDDLLDTTDPADGSWSFLNGPENITLVAGNTFDATGVMSGDYSFEFTLANPDPGCPDTDQITITVYPTPQFTVTASATACNTTSTQGETFVDLTSMVTGDAGTWSPDPNYTGDFTDLTNISFDGLAIGSSYVFTYTSNTATPPCTDDSQDLTVTVIDCDCPNLTITAPAAVCNDGGSLDLTTLQDANIAAGNWSVTGPQVIVLNGTVMEFADIMAGTYTLTYTPTVTPAPDCTQFSEVNLEVSDLQSAGIGGIQNICAGETEVIDLNSLLTGADPLGSWVETSTVLSTGFNATNESFSTNNQLPGTYTFEYQFDNSANPCPDVAETVTIIIEQVPVADAGPDFVLNCSDTETTLGGPLTTTGPGISYFWEELSGVAITNNTDQNIIGNTNGVYVLTVLNFASMCLDRDTVVISTDPNSLSFVATPIGSPCFGYNQGMIVIEQINGAQPPVTVSINGAAPIPIDEGDIIENLAPGVYDIDMEDAGGCTASTSLIIVEPDAWTVNAGNDDQIISGDTYGLMVTPSIDQSQISSITWTADSTVICTGAVADCINLDVEPEQLTTYCVEVTDLNGCIATDCVIIQARATKDIYIPNAFSPNGDNNNDWFWIQTDQQLEKLELAVYDRWGEQMFFNDNADVNDPTSFWNGEFNDTKVENGVYVYLLVVRFAGADNDEYFAGDITVIR